MRKSFFRIAVAVAAFMAVSFFVILVNQTLQLAEFAERINPIAGEAVFWGLVFFYIALGLVPVVLFVRLPRVLVPPTTDEGPEYEAHLKRLCNRLRTNPRLEGYSLDSPDQLEEALTVLDEEAEAIVRAAGSRAFLTTAISQNGSLDALLVLGIQTQLVWSVAQVYTQRPSLRGMTYLYANVMATALLASELDEADMSEVIQPVLSTMLGSAASVVPGLQVASSVFTNSILSGSANAFLTLRVGLVSQEFSRALVRPERRALRRSAMVRAAGMLGGIATSGAARVSSAVAKASGKAVTGAVVGVGRRVKDAGSAVASRIPFRKGRGEEEDLDPSGSQP